MSSWVFFALLAAIGFASVSVIYKVVFEKLKAELYFVLLISAVLNLLAGLGIFIFRGFTLLNPFGLVLALLGGLSVIIAILFFFKAVRIGDASVVGPLFNLNGLFIAVLAAIFLGEIFSPIQYLGVLLLVLGAVWISKEKGAKFKLSSALWLMAIGTFAYSVSSILTKFLLELADYWTIFAYFRVTLFIMFIPILAYNYKTIKKAKKSKAILGVTALAESAGLLAGLLFTIALSLGPATLVGALTLTNPFFTLLAVILLSTFLPNILKEDMGWQVLLQKGIAISLMVIGAILII